MATWSFLTAIKSVLQHRPVSDQGGPERGPLPAPAAWPRVLVVTRSYESALTIAPTIEAAEVVPIFVATSELWRADDLAVAPAAILVLREIATEDKAIVCASLRASDRYVATPIVVVTTLAEGTLSLPADAVMRPPASLADALAEVKRLIAAVA